MRWFATSSASSDLRYRDSARGQERALAAWKEDKRGVDQAILRLASVPGPAGAKLLVGPKRLWRLRVGDKRIVYRVIDKVMLIVVVKIGHRGEVYRRR